MAKKLAHGRTTYLMPEDYRPSTSQKRKADASSSSLVSKAHKPAKPNRKRPAPKFAQIRKEKIKKRKKDEENDD